MSDVEAIVANALADFAATTDPAALENAKARFLGRDGAVTQLLKSVGRLPAQERREAGSRINEAKARIEQGLEARRQELRAAELERRLREDMIDVTQPGRGMSRGGLHPITRVRMRIETLFRSLPHARTELAAWRTDYNTSRPHSRLGWLTPQAYAASRRSAITAQEGISNCLTPIAAG